MSLNKSNSSESDPIARIFAYLKPDRPILYLSILASFINKILDLAPPVLVGIAIDVVSSNSPVFMTNLFGSDPKILGLVLGVLGFLVFGMESFFQWLYSLGFMTLAQNIQHKLRVECYEAVQKREMKFFENHRLGETMSVLSDDINQLERFLNTVFNDIIQLISLFIISAYILFTADTFLSFIAIFPMPLVIIGALSFRKLLSPKYLKVREAVSHINARLENNISGIQVIKAFTAELFETSRLKNASSNYKKINIEAIKLSTLFTPLIRTLVAIGFALVLYFGAIRTLEGVITPGVFTLFAMMCQRILWPLTRLGTILDEMERCKASAIRIFGLIDSKSTLKNGTQKNLIPNSPRNIELSNLSFSYGKHKEILKNISFNINKGETIGIAGETGSGKSTFVKLLLRFYDPTDGAIKFDSQDIRTLDIQYLRQQISLVSQDIYIFHGTVLENIRYGYEQASLDDAIKAAKKAQLHKFIESLPDGYQSICGERGIKLSGGQRQRLSIARALLKNAPIIVLDEATSSVDTETERLIQTSLSEYTKGKTAIIIAHRLSTIRNADKILVIKAGKIVESGTHQELIKNKSTYYDLWVIQSGEVSS